MAEEVKRIPYGIADFERLRRDNSYYVDKTPYIPLLEKAGRYLFFVRPRRIGKSLMLSVLESYYDLYYKDRFEEFFGDTWIGANPTPERGRCMVLRFNFSVVDPDPARVQESFRTYIELCLESFQRTYPDLLGADFTDAVINKPDPMRSLFRHMARRELKIYVQIDEYDNFANIILTTYGQDAYHELTHGSGPVRYFFTELKEATTGTGSGLDRLHITGVSPITLDDVTSGFNIGTNISLDEQFNAMLGFTEKEVAEQIEYYKSNDCFPLYADESLSLMRQWYGNYRFYAKAESPVFNSDMVLYFVQHVIRLGRPPDYLIDDNVRIDYGKLRHLVLTDRRLNGNFSLLKQVMDEDGTASVINKSFPLDGLSRPENFTSLLHFLGLLTFSGETLEGKPVLRVPNLTIEKLMYGYLRRGFDDVNVFRIDLAHLAGLLGAMAYRGEWTPFFRFLAEEIEKQTSIRDYIEGEKVVQTFFLAYLNIADYFLARSEREFGKGFVDLFLEPFLVRYPDMRYGYLVEFKYIKRGDFSESKLNEVVRDSRSQLTKYAGDPRVARAAGGCAIKKLVIVFNGWELAHCEEHS